MICPDPLKIGSCGTAADLASRLDASYRQQSDGGDRIRWYTVNFPGLHEIELESGSYSKSSRMRIEYRLQTPEGKWWTWAASAPESTSQMGLTNVEVAYRLLQELLLYPRRLLVCADVVEVKIGSKRMGISRAKIESQTTTLQLWREGNGAKSIRYFANKGLGDDQAFRIQFGMFGRNPPGC